MLVLFRNSTKYNPGKIIYIHITGFLFLYVVHSISSPRAVVVAVVIAVYGGESKMVW
jgi:hypothetical protein